MSSSNPPSPIFFIFCEFSKSKAFSLKLKTGIMFGGGCCCRFSYLFFTVMVGVDSQYGLFSTHFPSMRDLSILVQSEWSLSLSSEPLFLSPFYCIKFSLSFSPSPMYRRGPKAMPEKLFWNFLSVKSVF